MCFVLKFIFIFNFAAHFVYNRTFNYVNQSITEMMTKAASQCEDFHEFNIDVCSIDWEDYLKNCVLGFQKYMLNSKESDLPAAKRKLKGFVFQRI